MADPKKIAVIMAGGSGTRFWPASRPDRPKQYLNLVRERSLIQSTVDRLRPSFPTSQIVICSTASQREWLGIQLPDITRLILEPEGKNTAACIALSALTLLKEGAESNTVMVTLPADHFIQNEERFRSFLNDACREAVKEDALVTFGIVPAFAHTGYGYIERGAPSNGHFYRVERFVEKPDAAKAESYLKTGRFYWNSGMFVWTLGAIERAFLEFLPEVWKSIAAALKEGGVEKAYSTLPSLPVDTAILERAKNVLVLPADIGWNDVGSWSAVYSLSPNDKDGNVVMGPNTLLLDTSDSLVYGPTELEVALVGVKNVMVVFDGKRLLVCDRAHDQQVRETSKYFKEK